MRYWLMNQNQTYINEVGGGYSVSAKFLRGRESDIFQLGRGVCAECWQLLSTVGGPLNIDQDYFL